MDRPEAPDGSRCLTEAGDAMSRPKLKVVGGSDQAFARRQWRTKLRYVIGLAVIAFGGWLAWRYWTYGSEANELITSAIAAVGIVVMVIQSRRQHREPEAPVLGIYEHRHRIRRSWW